MYTTIIHPLRIAYNLSINEYCVLEAVRGLQQSEGYGFWCVQSQVRIAKGLGMSDRWITECYKSLEAKGLLKRRRDTASDTAVRTTDEWNEWFNPVNDNYLLYLKTESLEVLTGDVKGLRTNLLRKITESGEESSPGGVK